MKRAIAMLIAASAVLEAACSAGGVPGAAIQPGTVSAAPTAPPGNRRVRATFVIRVPRKRRRIRAAYISPATQSLTISVDGATPVAVNLTTASPNCTPTGTALQCQIKVAVLAGRSHTLSIVTYDETNGNGQQLSANTGYTLAAGATTAYLTLGGIAKSIAVLAPNVPQISGSQASGYTMYGQSTQTFTVVPVDADGYSIIGAGAPAVQITSPPAPVPFAVTAPSSPGSSAWSFSSSYSATNPLTPASATVTAVSTPVPDSGGATITTPVPFTLYQPWIYVTNEGSEPPNAVGVFTEAGAVVPGVASGFSHVPSPTGITYDAQSGNHWIYVADGGTANVICVYDVLGNLITVSPATWSAVGDPTAMVYSPLTNYLYVANAGYGGDDIPANVSAYTGGGSSAVVSGTFPNAGGPTGIAYDPHNQWLYESDGIGLTVHAFDTQGNPQTTSGTFPGPARLFHRGGRRIVMGYIDPTGIAYDTNNGMLYVADLNSASVYEYDEQGNLQTPVAGTWQGLEYPEGVLYDPYDGLIYVVDNGENTVFIYNENGASVGSFPSGPNGTAGANGIAIVP